MEDTKIPHTWKFLAISQLNFPDPGLNRKYLMDLVRDVVVLERVQSVIVAGGLLAGKYIKTLFKSALKENGIRARDEKEEFRDQFVDTLAHKLSDFLPTLPEGVNYHIISSPAPAYDAADEDSICREILVRLFEIRNERQKDIRLYLDDAEPRIPIQWPKPAEIRVLVPQHKPWYSRLVTNLLQRLARPFAGRTFTGERPVLILAGCTGSGANIPSLQGVPTISAPAGYKINKVRTTESMVGCVVVSMRLEGKNVRYVEDTFDFRPFVSMERQSLIPEEMPVDKKRVLFHLSQNSQGFDTLYNHLYGFHADQKKPEKVEEEKAYLKKNLDALIARGLAVYKPEINRYELSKERDYGVRINLNTLMERAKKIRVVAYACLHVGALKSLYATFVNYIPVLAEDTDALFGCGDIIQGLAHNFGSSGEVIPTLNTYDKQSLKAAQLHGNVLLQIFDRRYEKYKGDKLTPEERIEKCLITFVYCLGNHDMWVHFQQLGLPLWDFEREIKRILIAGVSERVPGVSYATIERLVNKHIVRVGETERVEINGIGIGVTHPHKGGAETKSARVQQVIEAHVARKHPLDVVLELVGNFHTAAAIHFPQFGRTYLGIMLGAMLKTTQFEKKINKVVDYGPVAVTVWVDPRTGKLLKNTIEFHDDMIHPLDRRIVEADKITESMVIRVAKYLASFGDLPLR
ncbi:MAG: hypothetical protein KGI50_02740 [Patescibacteria group bacterium]|nr:hypothetical protein [Patescibacteria group bacterium]MDE2438571.1 hypothetical protein [Patescibacteria group bacterium]